MSQTQVISLHTVKFRFIEYKWKKLMVVFIPQKMNIRCKFTSCNILLKYTNFDLNNLDLSYM